MLVMRKNFVAVAILFGLVAPLIFSPHPANAFVSEGQYPQEDIPGVFRGIWHGLLAPYSLIARLIVDDIVMYATPNTGWWYDAGFLIGVAGSLPVGWIAAILSGGYYFLFGEI